MKDAYYTQLIYWFVIKISAAHYFWKSENLVYSMLSVTSRALIRCSWDSEIKNDSRGWIWEHWEKSTMWLLLLGAASFTQLCSREKFNHLTLQRRGGGVKLKFKKRCLVSEESNSGCWPNLRERVRTAANMEGSREACFRFPRKLSFHSSHSLCSLCCLLPGSLHPELPEGAGVICHHMSCTLHPGLPLSEEVLRWKISKLSEAL